MALHYGHAKAPLVRVVPDGRYPGMWRVEMPDGRLSDMTNLSRAKDAAVAICERGSPPRNRRRFRWEIEAVESAQNSLQEMFSAPPLSPAPPAHETLPAGDEGWHDWPADGCAS
jgi:hypothetical protein